MIRNSISLLFIFVLLLAGTAWSDSLVGHWALDETSGSTAYDSSGNGKNGTLVNMDGSDWVSGMVNGALDFDGVNDYVTIARSSVLEIGNATTHELSVAAWVKSDRTTPPTGFTSIVGTGDGGWYVGSFPDTDELVFACWLLNGGSGQTAVVSDSTPVFDGNWHHVAAVFDGASVHIYVDGHHSETGTIGGTIRNMFNKPVLMAENAGATGRYWDGRIDDVKIYDYALSSEEIYHTLNPSYSWNPSPVSGAGSVALDADLSWSAGETAIFHDVYFGTSQAAVASAQRLPGDVNGDGPVDLSDVSVMADQWLTNPGSANPSADLDCSGKVDISDFAVLSDNWHQTPDPIYKGNQTATTYDPGTLAENTTYYWRIDEVNASEPESPWAGRVWSFTTAYATAPLGTIIVDPTNPARMVYSDTYENGHLKPVCFAGPGDPEDFFWNDTTNNLNLLTGRGARCTYITAVLQDFGGGNPGSGTALDTKLTEWEGYITQLENAGVITVFFFFDDSQPLTSNWQELVDKCVAKFQHHKLLIWSVAEEYGEALTTAQVSAVAARIKSQDENSHVVGVHQNHGNTFNFLSDSNLDMFFMQLNYTTPGELHTAVKNSNANGTKILNMAEAADHAKQTRTNVRLWNWASIMGGASAVQVLWMGRASDPADWNTVDKYNDCARLMDFMESTNLNQTTCRDDLARGNTDYVLANPGHVYIAYGDSGTSLGLSVVAGTYNVKWYDPVDGDWVDQGSQSLSAGDNTFTKPGNISAEAALYLDIDDGWSYGVETENYDTQLGSGWSLQTSTSGYSGSGYMQADSTGTLQYQINFPSAGTYYCYIRNWASTSENNGCHLDLDGIRLSELYDREAVYATKESKWNWATQWQLGESSHIGPLDIVITTAGNHTLGIVTRDLGFKIDRIIVIDHKIAGQDYTGTTAPAFLDELDTIPNGYN